MKITRASLLSEELNAETIEIANKLNDTTSSSAIKGALANDKDLQSPEQQPTIILDSDFHSLMVFQSGQYTVEINALFPYSTERKTSVQINIPTAAQTDLEFSVFRDIILAQPEQIQIGVSPFLEATKSSQIISSPSSSPSNPATTGTVVATLKCQIPPSVAVNITWNPKSEEDIKAEEKKKEAPLPLHATVKQEHNLSVLDNLLSVYSEFNYTILNGSMSLFQICCDPDLKILNVDVASENSVAVKRWDTSIVNPEDSGYDELVSTVDNLGEKDKEPKMKGKGMPRQLIRIILEYAVEKDLCLSVSSEKELPSSSCQFICPSFRHVRSSVTRETGHIGVDSLATVEVDQLGTTSSVAVLDVSELPKSVVQKAVNPLVLAYKFLVPNYNITLDVKKHDDVSVLTACIDSAHFVLTVSEEGKLMYKLILVIRNTQKQYLRVLLPSDAEIWTTSVNKQSVKPAKDNVTGEVLIPLQKLGGPEDEPSKQNNHTTLGHAKCVVEFLYVRQPNGGNAPETSATIDSGLVNKLKPVIGKGDVSSQQQQQFQLRGSPSTGNNLNRFEAPLKQFTTEGAISVSFPALDIPINYLFVSCYLPQEYNYSEFEVRVFEYFYFNRVIDFLGFFSFFFYFLI